MSRLRSILTLTAFSVLVIFGFFTPSSSAAELTLEEYERLRALDSSVLSPFCPGRLLKDCPSTAATELRNKIGKDIQVGKSDQEILSDLIAQYGESIRAAPLFQGFGITAWVVPMLFIVGGLILGVVWLRRRRAEQVADSSSQETGYPDIDAESRALVEREIHSTDNK